MAVDATCPSCQNVDSVPDTFRGKTIRCTKCKKSYRVEASAEASAPAVTAPAPLSFEVGEASPPTERDSSVQREPSRSSVPLERPARRPASRPERPERSRRGSYTNRSGSQAGIGLVGWIGVGILCVIVVGAVVAFSLMIDRKPTTSRFAAKYGTAATATAMRDGRDRPRNKDAVGREFDMVVTRWPEEPGQQEVPRDERLRTMRDGKFTKPSLRQENASYLEGSSANGDYIGAGKDYSYKGEDLRLTGGRDGITITVDGWRFYFAPPRGKSLKVGEYWGAEGPRTAFRPEISFFGQGRVCGTSCGDFVIWELEVKNGTITRLAIDFIHRCEANGAPYCGMIRINSSFE